jgi:hypothetical protein
MWWDTIPREKSHSIKRVNETLGASFYMLTYGGVEGGKETFVSSLNAPQVETHQGDATETISSKMSASLVPSVQ